MSSASRIWIDQRHKTHELGTKEIAAGQSTLLDEEAEFPPELVKKISQIAEETANISSDKEAIVMYISAGQRKVVGRLVP